tara:strand:+ start:557 stop:1177 length:621 start_codon:yes stop_codon:yes gene_type:complete
MKYPNNLHLLRSNKGLHQAEVATAIEVAQPEYSKMERGDRKVGHHIDKLCTFFSVKKDAILNDAVPINSNNDIVIKAEDLPVFGLPVPNCNESFQVNKQFLSYAIRPDYLVGANNSYCCFMFGTKMENRFFHGELLYVNPNAKIEVNDFVVVQIEVKGKIIAVVRRVYEITERQHKLMTINPENIETFKNSSMVGLHKIVGTRTNI